MFHKVWSAGLLALLTVAGSAMGGSLAQGEADARAKMIEGALLAVPQPMRDGATVVLDAPHASRLVLRQGSNDIICRASTVKTGFNAYCYAKAFDPFWTRYEALGAEGKTNAEIRDALGADARSGKLNLIVGATTYTMSGDSQESSLPLMAVFLPNATEASTGLSDKRDHFRPWLMWAGTPFAHIMIPGQ